MTVWVEAPARLHFGMLDLRGTRGRRFGGVGAGVPAPSVLVSAATEGGSALAIDGVPEASAAAERAAERVLTRYGMLGRGGKGGGAGVRVTVHRVLPAHQGLGSGTQLALAVGRAVAAVHGREPTAVELAAIVGRARRSAIGTYVFALGGCVLEGGRTEARERPAPLLARLLFPEAWRCVVAIPAHARGVSGAAEDRALAELPDPPVGDAERVAHLVLMALWPALADGDFAGFGTALAELQRINGSWFAAAQGGTYAAGASAALIAELTSWGAAGVGQSSWGPVVYALAPDPDAGAVLAARVRAWLATHGGGVVQCEPFSATGARVWAE